MSKDRNHVLWDALGVWFACNGKPPFYMKRAGVSNNRPKFETPDGSSYLFFNWTWMYYVEMKIIWMANIVTMRNLEKEFEGMSKDPVWSIEITDDNDGKVTICSDKYKEKNDEKAIFEKRQTFLKSKAEAGEKARKLEAGEMKKARQVEEDQREKARRKDGEKLRKEAVLKEELSLEKEDKDQVEALSWRNEQKDKQEHTPTIIVVEEEKSRPRAIKKQNFGPFYTKTTRLQQQSMPCQINKEKRIVTPLKRFATGFRPGRLKPLDYWSVNEVADWVSSLAPKYGNYRDSFINEGIDGESLVAEDHTVADLRRIGVKKPHAIKILRMAKRLGPKNPILMASRSMRCKTLNTIPILLDFPLHEKLRVLAKTCTVTKDSLKSLEAEEKYILQKRMNSSNPFINKDGFISHEHMRHGDFCRSISLALKVCGASCNFNSLVDKVKHRGTIDSISNSNEFVLLLMKDYFQRPCLFEYLVALALRKPVTVLLECDPRFGGFAIQEFDPIIPEVFRARIQAHEIVMVHRDYFDGMVEKLRLRMVRHKVPANVE